MLKDSEYVTSRDVADRIEELEGGGMFDVIRERNREVLASYESKKDAKKYITDNDYDPGRVIVEKNRLTDDDQQELDDLRGLADDAASIFGSSWTEGMTLYAGRYFDSNWAREQARSEGLNPGAWPLTLINWDEAAASKRDKSWTLVYFGSKDFYGQEN